MVHSTIAPGTWAYTVPGMRQPDAARVVDVLQLRLDALDWLALNLKHVQWNVGPHFIAVHTMIDPQVVTVRQMADEVAERIATLGSSPNGLLMSFIKRHVATDCGRGCHDALQHLQLLDALYNQIVVDQRAAIEATDDDPVTHDLLTSQAAELENFQWLLRAHAENASGELTW